MKIKRYIKEYASDLKRKANKYHLPDMAEQIDRVLGYCERQMITNHEAMWMLVEIDKGDR